VGCVQAVLSRRGSQHSLERSDRTFTIHATDSDPTLLKALSGTHRVQRIPPNGGGRKHTSTATIAVLDAQTSDALELKPQDLRVERMRGRGKGGQRRNKVETAVRVTHLPTGLQVVRTSGRSQAANLSDAKQDLSRQLDLAARLNDSQSEQENRNAQVDSERSGKDFTHTWYRGQVIHHASGMTWTTKQWKQGRLNMW
jgi:peptide chain release factor 1